MKDLNVPTTNTRRRLHAAAVKAGWVEDLAPTRPWDNNSDRFVKGDLSISVGFHPSGRLASAGLVQQVAPRKARDLGFTSRFSQIILWIGGDHAS